MNTKILFTDLDGTLVKHAGDVTQETVNATQKLISHGIELVIVTGRHPDLTKSIYSKLELKTPVIGCNGGVIKDINNNKILYANMLMEDKIKQAINIAKELGVQWVIYEKDKIYYKDMPPKSYKLVYENLRLPEALRANFVKIDSEEEMFATDNMFLKILLLFDNKPGIVNEGYGLLSEIEDVEVARSSDTYIDVMAMGSSKGKTIKRYLDMVNIKSDCIAAIGDAHNDIDMVEYAQIGFAMGNAVKSVKNIAQHVTRDVPKGFIDCVEYLLERLER